MVNLSLEENKLLVTPDSEGARTLSLRLDWLRIVFLFAPRSCRWPYVQKTDGRALANLEELSDEEMADLAAKASALGARAREYSLLLEDYSGHSTSLSLEDVAHSGVDLLGELSRYRSARRERLAGWTRSNPGLVVTGALGDHATLDPKGVRATGKFMPWRDLDRIEMTADAGDGLSGYRFIPRAGCASSELSVRMPGPKGELFTAEYTFFRSVADGRLRALLQAADAGAASSTPSAGWR